MPAIDPTVPPLAVRTAARRAPGGPPPPHTAGASVSTWCPGRPAHERVHRARVAPHMSACTAPGSRQGSSPPRAQAFPPQRTASTSPPQRTASTSPPLTSRRTPALTRDLALSARAVPRMSRSPGHELQDRRGRAVCPAHLISPARSAGGIRFPYPGSRRRSWKESAPMGAISYQDLGRIRSRSGDQGVCVFSRAGFGHKLLDQRRGGGGGTGRGGQGGAGGGWVSGRGGGPGGGAGSSATCAAGPGRSW